ncbi:hypothetical protein ACJJTC_017016 [Scirpophaga incertulas]
MCIERNISAGSGGNRPWQRRGRGIFRSRGGGRPGVRTYHVAESPEQIDQSIEVQYEEPVMQMSLAQYKPSPAKLLQGRALRTQLDALKPESAAKAFNQQRETGTTSSLRFFQPGDPVWYRTYRRGIIRWAKGQMRSKKGETDYNIQAGDRYIVHQHIDQIKIRFDMYNKSVLEQAYSHGGSTKQYSHLLYPNIPEPEPAVEAQNPIAEPSVGPSVESN